MLVAGCGGGGGGGGAPTAAAPPSPPPLCASFLLHGDSIDWGFDGTVRTSPTPAQRLAAVSGKPVTDASEPGTYLANDLQGTQSAWSSYGFAEPLATALSTAPERCVVTNSGINDMVVLASGPVETAAQYQVDLEQWVDTVRQAGKTPILVEMTPTTRADLAATQPAYLAIQRAVARSRGVALIRIHDAALARLDLLAADQVHWTDAGYAFLWSIEGPQFAAVTQ